MRDRKAYERMAATLVFVAILALVAKVAAFCVATWMIIATVWACFDGNPWGWLYGVIASVSLFFLFA